VSDQPAYPPQGAYPQSAYPAYSPPAYPPRPPAGSSVATPERIEAVAGTDFGLAYAQLEPIMSGQAVGSMILGIASILVTLPEAALGLRGAGAGWGALISGAFGILATLLGSAAIGIGVVATRSVKRSVGSLRGYGIGKAGIILGIIGVSLAVISFVLALIATLAG
jgi:hypothetical protein